MAGVVTLEGKLLRLCKGECERDMRGMCTPECSQKLSYSTAGVCGEQSQLPFQEGKDRKVVSRESAGGQFVRIKQADDFLCKFSSI